MHRYPSFFVVDGLVVVVRAFFPMFLDFDLVIGTIIIFQPFFKLSIAFLFHVLSYKVFIQFRVIGLCLMYGPIQANNRTLLRRAGYGVMMGSYADGVEGAELNFVDFSE